jgi:hypothetical protein
MTPGHVAFWIYLAAYSTVTGTTALVLGLIARFSIRPFDTSRRVRVFLGLLAVVGLIGAIAFLLSYRLTSEAGVVASLSVNSLVGPFLTGMVIFIWASGFPLSRILRGRS